ncbi:MAG: acyl-CoA dehydrogenase family protein [Pseudomonadales bacterium]|nr:acyl-CoA dehydrogenase family protein [Pseudomonadales bacterium]
MIRSPHYTDGHETFRTSVRRFIETEIAPHWNDFRKEGHVPREIWRRAGELGFLCTKTATEYGGGGGDLYHCLVVIEEQTRAQASELTFYLHSDIIAPYIELYGTDDQKARYLPRMARGEIVAAIAMTEPGGGSDLQAIRTTAIADGDSYVLNGQKVFISNGHVADLICVAAKTDPAQGAKGISLLLLETEGAEGFTRGRKLRKVGCKAQDSVELFFEDVRIPRRNLLGGVEGKGFQQLMLRLPEERLIMSMSSVANMESAIEETVSYTRERKVFGQRLIDLQNTRFKLAECKTKAVLARNFLEHCIDAFIDGRFDTVQGAMAKWWSSQRVYEVLDECLQLHGGYGYMTEYPIARRYADQRLARIAGGTNEIMKELIGRTL